MMKRILYFAFIVPLFVVGQTTIFADVKYGFTAGDSHTEFYNALAGENGTGNTLVFRDMGSPWMLTGPNTISLNNIDIVFEKGMTLEAKQGFFTNNQSLFKLSSAVNVNIEGYGAMFKMYPSDFTAGEFAMSIHINNATNVTIKGLTLDGSGGDGIYAAGWTNCLIEDVYALNHRRQGLSIIRCNGLTIRNSIFDDTEGTDPEAGIDVEPNNTLDDIVDLNIYHTVMRGNNGAGFMTAVSRIDGTQPDMHILLEDCYFAGNGIDSDNDGPDQNFNIGGTNNFGGAGALNPIQGSLTYRRIAIDGAQQQLFYSRKQDAEYSCTFENVVVRDLFQKAGAFVGTYEVTNYVNFPDIGNFQFNNFLLINPLNKPVFRVQAPSSMGNMRNITGTMLNVSIGTVTVWDHAGSYDPVNNINVTLSVEDISSLPLATVEVAGLADASKDGQTGIFRFTRTGGRTDFPLFIKYAVSSPSVDQGDDIHYLTGAVVLEAGELFRDVEVVARDNGITESDRPVTVTIEARSDLYTIGANNSAVIDVVDVAGVGGGPIQNGDFNGINALLKGK